MKLPRDVSADRLIRVLKNLGYQAIRQKGSHIRLKHNGPPVHLVTVLATIARRPARFTLFCPKLPRCAQSRSAPSLRCSEALGLWGPGFGFDGTWLERFFGKGLAWSFMSRLLCVATCGIPGARSATTHSGRRAPNSGCSSLAMERQECLSYSGVYGSAEPDSGDIGTGYEPERNGNVCQI